MKWGKHIFGDDPRWGRNGRGKVVGHLGKRIKTEFGEYDTEKTQDNWGTADEIAREGYYRQRDRKFPLSKLKKSTDKLSNPPTLDEVKKLANKINPHRDDPDAAEKGYMNNCIKCAMCTVLRFKGYDAEAYAQENGIGHPDTPNDPYFSTGHAFDLTKARSGRVTLSKSKMPTKYNPNKREASNQRMEYKRAADGVNNGLKDGDYGYIASEDPRTGSGHASAFVKINGRTYGVDGQIGLVQPIEEYFDDVGWMYSSHRFVICTDAQPREIGVGRFVDEKKFKK